MDRYLVISGTNRKNSYTKKVANVYLNSLLQKNLDAKLLALDEVPVDFYNDYDIKSANNKRIQEDFIIPANKIIFIAPEYNGSIPGVLKFLIDSSNIKASFHNKKGCIVGVASGRAGNLRGMDHLHGILNHIKIDVIHKTLPISKIEDIMYKEGHFIDEETPKLIENQIKYFINF